MIAIGLHVLKFCAQYAEHPDAALSPMSPADVLWEIAQAAIEAGRPRSRAWWEEKLPANGLVRMLITHDFLRAEDDGFTFMASETGGLLGSGDSSKFDEFWREFKIGPKAQSSKAKGAKAAAERAWKKLCPVSNKLFERIMTALKHDVESGWSASYGTNPHASTWLNQRRWEDDENSSNAPSAPESAQLDRSGLAARIAENARQRAQGGVAQLAGELP